MTLMKWLFRFLVALFAVLATLVFSKDDLMFYRILTVAFVVMTVAMLMINRECIKVNRSLIRTLHWYQNWHQTYNGWHHKYGQLHLMSTDCGRTWYHVEFTEDKMVETYFGHEAQHGYKIIGPADPQMMTELLALREIGKRASKKQLLDPEDPEDRKLLEQAGVEITVKNNP